MAEEKKPAENALPDEQLNDVSGGSWFFDDLDKALGIKKTCTHCNGTGTLSNNIIM